MKICIEVVGSYLLLLLNGVLSYNLTILHTNDVHARIDEAHKYGGVCSAEQSAAGDCVGGASRLSTMINELRGVRSNVLLLDGGDQFQGTFWFYVYRGMATAQFMKKLGYDAMAFGNHEFDIGLPPLQNFVNNVSETFDVLSANIDNTNEPGLTGYKKYVIKDVGGRKIGIIGYTTTDTILLTTLGNTGRLIFNDEVQSIKNAVDAIKSEDSTVNIFIAVGHAGFEVDQKIAREVEDIDVVVGGHTNTFLWNGDAPSTEKPEGSYPFVVTKNNGQTALCVQAFTFSKYLGNLDIIFDDSGNPTEWNGNPVLLDKNVAKDPDVEAMLAPYRTIIAEEGDKPISKSAVKLDNSECRKKECNFGNFVADAWLHSNVEFGTEVKWARAAIALVNGGSIRAPIAKGQVANKDLLTAMPFGNTIESVIVKGSTLKSVFENSAVALTDQAKSGRFLQHAGAHVTYNIKKPVGQRVAELRLRCLECEVPRYKLLDLEANYTILVSSFMASGGDGYSMLPNEKLDGENLGLGDADMVMEYMKVMGTIYPTEEGRVRFQTDADSPKCETMNGADSTDFTITLTISTMLMNLFVRCLW